MNPMSAAKGRKWLVIPLILVFLIVGRILTIGQKEDVKGIAKIQQEEGVPVDVTQIARRDIEVWEAFSGTVKGIRQGTIRANGPQEIRLLHQALRVFYDSSFAERHGALTRALVRLGIRCRQQLRLLEFRFGKDKDVFGGTGITASNRILTSRE